MNSSELFHLWANQSRPSARSGNVWFEGSRLFSYQTCVAQIETNPQTGERLCLFTSRSHSVSTGKQIIYARRAWGYSSPALSVDLGERGSRGASDLWEKQDVRGTVCRSAWLSQWADEFRRKADKLALQASRSRVYGESLVGSLLGLIESGAMFARFFDVPHPLPTVNGETSGQLVARLTEAAKAQAAKEAAKAKEREAKRLAELADAIAAWKRGERHTLPHTSQIFLRLAAPDERGRDVVETSWGARVLLRDAAKLFRACAAYATGNDTLRSRFVLFGWNVGPYPLRAIDEQGNATVGCHSLRFVEMQRLADEVGETRLAAALAEKPDVETVAV